jgi:hypothetical protein
LNEDLKQKTNKDEKNEKSDKKFELPLVVQMINDFEMLMPLKNRIERNGLKNEFFKKRFEETNKFDKK